MGVASPRFARRRTVTERTIDRVASIAAKASRPATSGIIRGSVMVRLAIIHPTRPTVMTATVVEIPSSSSKDPRTVLREYTPKTVPRTTWPAAATSPIDRAWVWRTTW